MKRMTLSMGLVVAVALLAAGNAMAHQISTTVTISATPGTTVPEGTIVTLIGNVLCTGSEHICPTPPIGGKIMIQMLQLEGVGVACDTEGAVWSDHIEGGDGEAPDANGDVFADFNTEGLGGQTIGFRAHYVTPGGGHSPATGNSECLNIVITEDLEGCSHGFWKTHSANAPGGQADEWPPTGYSLTDTLGSVSTIPGSLAAFSGNSFATALDYTGGPGLTGGFQVLMRNAVAALLNAAHPDVAYPLTDAEVIADVDDALATEDRDELLALEAVLDGYNNLGCPLD